MKALSLRQPWAHAVVHLGKELENRRWDTKFRGEFLIHAAKGMTRAEYFDASDFICDVKGWTVGELAHDLPGPKALARGGIVGRARIVDVIPPCTSERFARCPHPWHMHQQFAFVLRDVEPLPFVPCTGMLGFWEVPPDVLRQIAAAKAGGQ
jgi:hypothetical protein